MRPQLEILPHPAARWGEDASILVAAGAAALLLQDCLRGKETPSSSGIMVFGRQWLPPPLPPPCHPPAPPLLPPPPCHLPPPRLLRRLKSILASSMKRANAPSVFVIAHLCVPKSELILLISLSFDSVLACLIRIHLSVLTSTRRIISILNIRKVYNQKRKQLQMRTTCWTMLRESVRWNMRQLLTRTLTRGTLA